jgi:hypothetical protein
VAARSDELLLVDLSREVLLAIAPEEVPLLAATATAFLESGGSLPRRRTLDDSLGFGSQEALAAISPVVLVVSSECLKILLGDLANKATRAGKDHIIEAWHRWFGSKDRASVPVHLSADERRHIHDVALKQASRLQLSKDKAALLADAIVGALP